MCNVCRKPCDGFCVNLKKKDPSAKANGSFLLCVARVAVYADVSIPVKAVRHVFAELAFELRPERLVGRVYFLWVERLHAIELVVGVQYEYVGVRYVQVRAIACVGFSVNPVRDESEAFTASVVRHEEREFLVFVVAEGDFTDVAAGVLVFFYFFQGFFVGAHGLVVVKEFPEFPVSEAESLYRVACLVAAHAFSSFVFLAKYLHIPGKISSMGTSQSSLSRMIRAL